MNERINYVLSRGRSVCPIYLHLPICCCIVGNACVHTCLFSYLSSYCSLQHAHSCTLTHIHTHKPHTHKYTITHTHTHTHACTIPSPLLCFYSHLLSPSLSFPPSPSLALLLPSLSSPSSPPSLPLLLMPSLV